MTYARAGHPVWPDRLHFRLVQTINLDYQIWSKSPCKENHS